MSDPRELLEQAAAWPDHDLDLGTLRARANRRRGIRRATGGVAAVVVVAVAAFALGPGWPGSSDRVNVATRPDVDRRPPGPEPTAPSPLVTDITPIEVAPAGPRPEQVVGATTGGEVVVVDAGTGATVRQVVAGPDPHVRRDDTAPGPNTVGNVALSADGRTVYYSSVGEPACGSTVHVLVSGEAGAGFGMGNFVAPSPDGRHLATSGCDVTVQSGPEATPVSLAQSGADGWFGALAWSADGRYLAVERTPGSSPDGPIEILVLDLLTARTAADAVVLRDPDGVGYKAPAFRRDGRLVVAQQAATSGIATARVLDSATGEVVATFPYGGTAIRDQSYDATHTWLLVTMADGSLRWFGGGQDGTLPSGFTAADW